MLEYPFYRGDLRVRTHVASHSFMTRYCRSDQPAWLGGRYFDAGFDDEASV